MLTCVPWVKIISIRGVRFRFWCWTRLSMLKKVPELAWTTVNFYSSWESVFLTSGIKLNTKKWSRCQVSCAHLVWFCQLLHIGSTLFHFPRVWGVPLRFGVKLYSGCWKKVSYLYHIFTPGERVSPTSQNRVKYQKIKSMPLCAVQHYKMYRK